jgi:hypothetical protein
MTDEIRGRRKGEGGLVSKDRCPFLPTLDFETKIGGLINAAPNRYPINAESTQPFRLVRAFCLSAVD